MILLKKKKKKSYFLQGNSFDIITNQSYFLKTDDISSPWIIKIIEGLTNS